MYEQERYGFNIFICLWWQWLSPDNSGDCSFYLFPLLRLGLFMIFYMLSQRAWICVPFSAAWYLTSVWFLQSTQYTFKIALVEIKNIYRTPTNKVQVRI